jgi:hypothetical protein
LQPRRGRRSDDAFHVRRVGDGFAVAAHGWVASGGTPIGTWLKKRGAGEPAMTPTVEEWGAGKARLTWRLPDVKMVLTLESALDGSFAPLLVDGKPSGQTMSIELVDKRHAAGAVKVNGKSFGTSKSTFSEDFNTLTVENDFSESVGGNPAGKSTETWVRQ